jgi:hypothetical protein
MDTKCGSTNAAGSGKRRKPLEGRDELRATVRVPGIVDRVDADENVANAKRFGPRQGKSEKYRVPCGNVGRGDVWQIRWPILGHWSLGRQ